MKGYSPSDKLVVRDSVDLSDISEVEDDVFIRDGRTCKMYEDTGLKRPLMPPRRKTSKGQKIIPIMKKRTRCWTCCEPFCYGLAAITILIGNKSLNDVLCLVLCRILPTLLKYSFLIAHFCVLFSLPIPIA